MTGHQAFAHQHPCWDGHGGHDPRHHWDFVLHGRYLSVYLTLDTGDADRLFPGSGLPTDWPCWHVSVAIGNLTTGVPKPTARWSQADHRTVAAALTQTLTGVGDDGLLTNKVHKIATHRWVPATEAEAAKMPARQLRQ